MLGPAKLLSRLFPLVLVLFGEALQGDPASFVWERHPQPSQPIKNKKTVAKAHFVKAASRYATRTTLRTSQLVD